MSKGSSANIPVDNENDSRDPSVSQTQTDESRSPTESLFCAFPFQHLCFGNEGTARICCMALEPITEDGVPMSLYTNSFEEIWNSRFMKDVRQKMLDGERVPQCEVCYTNEAATSTSYRIGNGLRPLPDKPIDLDATRAQCETNGYRVDEKPGFLKLELGNLCNLKCRMCYGGASSEIERDPVHVRWAGGADALHAIWDGNRAVIGPQSKIGVKRTGVSEPEAMGQWAFWTEPSACFNVPIRSENPPKFLTIEFGKVEFKSSCQIVINGRVSFEGIVDNDSQPIFIALGDLGECTDLSIGIVSKSDGHATREGVPLSQITLYRDEDERGSELLKSRLPGPQLWFKNDPLIFKELLGDGEGLQRLYVTGGEPLLEPRFEEVLDFLIKRDAARNIHLEFTTNCTTVKESLLDKIKRFKSSYITLSLDGIGSVQEYIRYPSSWPVIERNIRILKDWQLKLMAIPVVQAYNMLDLSDIYLFSAELGIELSYASTLQWPTWLRTVVMPRNVQLEAAARLKNLLASGRVERESYIRDQIQSLIANFEASVDPDEKRDIRVFNLFTNDLDVTRGQSLKNSLPTLYELISASGYHWTDETVHATSKFERKRNRDRVHAWL